MVKWQVLSICGKCDCGYNQALYWGISGETESRDSVVRIWGIWATKTRRFLDSIKAGVKACGPKHTPSF